MTTGEQRRRSDGAWVVVEDELGRLVTRDSVATPGQPGVAVINPDGSNISLSGSSAGAAHLDTNQVSVDTTVGGVQIVAARPTRRAVTIVNHGTTDVYLGLSGVTTATGVLLRGIAGAAVTIMTVTAVFGIVGAASQVVSYEDEYD